MKLTPENYEAEASKEEKTFDEKKKTELITKAQELLTEPMSAGDLVKAIEYFYVYGRAPEILNGKPQTEGGNIPVQEGHESEHLPSEWLEEVVVSLEAEETQKLNPKK
jgi:hypothetical protein